MPASSSRITGTSRGSVGTASSASTPAPRLKIAFAGRARMKSSGGGLQTSAKSGMAGASGHVAIADAIADARDDAGRGCGDGVLHLHRLENQERRAALDLVPRLDEHGDD